MRSFITYEVREPKSKKVARLWVEEKQKRTDELLELSKEFSSSGFIQDKQGRPVGFKFPSNPVMFGMPWRRVQPGFFFPPRTSCQKGYHMRLSKFDPIPTTPVRNALDLPMEGWSLYKEGSNIYLDIDVEANYIPAKGVKLVVDRT